MSPDQTRDFMRKVDPGASPIVRGNGWVEARCPFAPWTHPNGLDRRPSFACSTEGPGVYVCHSCGRKGRLDWLPKNLTRFATDRAEELRLLTSEIASGVMMAIMADPVAEPEPVPVDLATWEGYFLPIAGTPGQAYLDGRRIGRSAAARAGVVWDPDEKRVVLPVKDTAGVLWGFTGRTTTDHRIKVRNYAGLRKERQILGAEHWTGRRPLILLEGLFAYLRLLDLYADDQYDVGAIMGSKMSKAQAAIVSIRLHPRVVLMLDDDEAGNIGLYGTDGKSGAVAMLRRLGRNVSAPAWPEGKTDPDQLTSDDLRLMCMVPPPF